MPLGRKGDRGEGLEREEGKGRTPRCLRCVDVRPMAGSKERKGKGGEGEGKGTETEEGR